MTAGAAVHHYECRRLGLRRCLMRLVQHTGDLDAIVRREPHDPWFDQIRALDRRIQCIRQAADRIRNRAGVEQLDQGGHGATIAEAASSFAPQEIGCL